MTKRKINTLINKKYQSGWTYFTLLYKQFILKWYEELEQLQRETQLSVDVSPNFCDCFQYLILGIGTLIMRLKMARYKL